MTIETSNLLGGLLCGALLGVAGTVSAIWLLAGRMPARVCVRMARRLLADLKGEGIQEIMLLFRVRDALRQLETARRSPREVFDENKKHLAPAIPVELLQVGAPGSWSGQ